jgi:HAD superfamily hydrolase (TIGR01509 family)
LIKNIIFDIGNVLMHFQPKEYLETFISCPDKREKTYKAIFGSKEWLMLDRGVITEPEAVELFKANCPEVSDEIQTAMDHWTEKMLTPIVGTGDYLIKLKNAGYAIYILSNYQDRAFNYIRSRNKFFDYADGFVLSFEDKLMKPEKEIYKTLLSRYNLESSETVFIDDTPENIFAAGAVGIHGIVFTGLTDLTTQMNSLISS